MYKVDDSFRMMMNQRHEIDLKSSEEITNMVIEYKKTGDKELYNEIYQQIYRLAISIAMRYKTSAITSSRYDLQDIIQQALVGFLYALRKYDPESGNLFSTYAVHWMQSYIGWFISKQEYSFKAGKMVVGEMRKYFGHLKNNPEDYNLSDKELAKKIGISKDAVRRFRYIDENEVRLDRYKDNGDDEDTNIGECLLSDRDPRFKNIEYHERRVEIIKLMNENLKEAEVDVICKRFGLFGEPMTLQEVGDIRGICKERVRQIQDNGIKKLRKVMDKKKITYSDMVI